MRELPSECDVIVVGAGFAGCYLLKRLRDEGFDVVLVEAGDGLGGIWHWNCYPGARVDSHVPVYEYSDPAVWEPWNWTERFPGWAEMRRYFDYVDSVWDLRRDVVFGARVTGSAWDETDRRWHTEVNGDATVRSRFVVLCTGFASKPYVPPIPGLDDFRGEAHHTARWPQDGLDLTGQRVGVVGVGASGVQVIQEAGHVAGHVTVFQRTPIMALPMRQEMLTEASQELDKERYPSVFERRVITAAGFDFDAQPVGATEVSAAERTRVFDELWGAGGLRFWAANFHDVIRNLEANRYAYDYWRDRVRERIADPALAELVAPTEPPHPFGVKRPSLEQDYYEVLDQPNVDVVDLRRDPIDHVGADCVALRSGRTVDLDVLVLATGFDAVTGGLTQIDLQGTAGGLAESWANGVHTQLGMVASGFPNLLFVYGPQSPSGFCNGPTAAEVQGDMLTDLLVDLRARSIDRIEAEPDAEAAWREVMREIGDATLFPLAESWYMGANIPGKPRELLNFPGLHIYRELCDAALADGPRGFRLG